MIRGGGISSSSLAQLLSGELENVTVTGDANFDRALKAAVQKGGSDPDAVLAALKEELSISGGVLSFSISGLGGGSAGRQGLSVLFEPGTNPTAAANNAVTNWLGVLRGLAGSGAYSAHVSMVQAEGGYILAIAVTVEQPGGLGSDDDDGPGPDPVRNLTADSFDDFINYIQEYSGTLSRTTITLAKDYEPDVLTVDLNCGGATVVLTGSKPLFNMIATNVTLSNLNLEVTDPVNTGSNNSSGNLCVGAVAAVNNGIIQSCDVTISGSIAVTYDGSEVYAGGIVGENYGIITDCHVTITGSGSISATSKDALSAAYAGGIVGRNYGSGRIENCTVTGGKIFIDNSTTSQYARAGGITGYNDGSIQRCTVTNCSISVPESKEGSNYQSWAIDGNNPNNRGNNTVGEDVYVNGERVTPTT